MGPIDDLLCLDMGTHDCYYQIRRQSQDSKTVVYVHLQDLDIIAQDRQTYGPSLIEELRKAVEPWEQHWTALDVFKEDGKFRYRTGQWKPHYLPSDTTTIDLPHRNIRDLEI